MKFQQILKECDGATGQADVMGPPVRGKNKKMIRRRMNIRGIKIGGSK
jgi:hypothetical protein